MWSPCTRFLPVPGSIPNSANDRKLTLAGNCSLHRSISGADTSTHSSFPLTLPAGQSQALQQFLKNAQRALERNGIDQGLHHLHIARNYLRIQTVRRIDPAVAQTLDADIRMFTDAMRAP